MNFINKLYPISLAKKRNIGHYLIMLHLIWNRASMHADSLDRKIDLIICLQRHPDCLPISYSSTEPHWLFIEDDCTLVLVLMRLQAETGVSAPRHGYLIPHSDRRDYANDEVIIPNSHIPDLKVGPAQWVLSVLYGEQIGDGDAVPDIALFLEDASHVRDVALKHWVRLVVDQTQRVVKDLWCRWKGGKIGGTAATHWEVGQDIDYTERIPQGNNGKYSDPLRSKSTDQIPSALGQIFGSALSFSPQFNEMVNNNMSEKLNSPTTAPPPSDPNYTFLSAMNRNRLEADTINFREIDQKIEGILRRLGELHPNDQNQWREVQEGKIASLGRCVLDREAHTLHQVSNQANRMKFRALKEHLRILVIICNKLKLEYDTVSITYTLKQLYYNEYGREIFSQFEKVGFSTHEFLILSGKQQSSSFFSFCCCGQEGLDS